MRLPLLSLQTFSVIATVYTTDYPITPIAQWWLNNGYCGELSTILSVMQWGLWLGQYDLRSLGSGGSQKVASDQYLPGTNDVVTTGGALRMNYIQFGQSNCPSGPSNSCSQAYLAWIKYHLRRHRPVTISVYENMCIFSNCAGGQEYDHIMLALSVTSDYDDDLYHATDRLTYTDHGLYTPASPNCPSAPCTYPFVYTVAFSDFQGTRSQANKNNNVPFLIPTDNYCYGIVHTGLVDPNAELLRAVITTNINPQVGESPVISGGSNMRPATMAVTLTVTVHGATPSSCILLLRYATEASIPVDSYFVNRATAANSWNLPSDGSGTASTNYATTNGAKSYFRAVMDTSVAAGSGCNGAQTPVVTTTPTPTRSVGAPPPPTPGSPSLGSSSSASTTLAGGAIAGIVIGSLVFVGIVGIAAALYVFKIGCFAGTATTNGAAAVKASAAVVSLDPTPHQRYSVSARSEPVSV